MAQRYDAIVLGLGGMGTATAFALARRGCRVLGLEQFAVGHDRGSSHGQTRVIRMAYYEHSDYVPLLRRAYDLWYELEQRTGRHLFTECGVLNIGPPTGEVVPGVLRASAEHGLPVERISATDLQRRFPVFRFGEAYEGVLEPRAGFLYVEECVHAHAQAARELGADLREQEAAVSWEAVGSGVSVRTTLGHYVADHLVITAGPWAGPLLGQLGLPLRVLRKTVFWVGTEDDRLFARHRFPIYLAETAAGFYYGFPVIDGRGKKLARHDGGAEVADPALVDRVVSAPDEADCRAFLRDHLPQASGPVRQAAVCLYTVTPDHHFILDLHPEHPQVVIAGGFSGHGFKFAPVVGELMADLAESGRTELPIGRFQLNRWSTGG
jgi:sarcosine oxidase